MKKILIMFMVLALMLSVSVATYAAVSQSTILDGTYTEIYNVTFSAGTDTFSRIYHGLGADPEMISIAAMDANCTAVRNVLATELGSGMPYVNDHSSASVGIEKNSIGGSATCIVRVTLQTVHSIIR